MDRLLDETFEHNELRKEIEEYYLPRQLIDAILEHGEIPKRSRETQIGIGFLDIADYSHISGLLSPAENQAVLNGLFTAFNLVLQEHGGYLNKIEGDSLMFHFGGLTDTQTPPEMDPNEALRNIAERLFHACVRLQRVCSQFNKANERFFSEGMQGVDPESLEDLKESFQIIQVLRSNDALISAANAYYQIRIRIGASIGEVTIGNLGPRGAKQWDVIGVPVIVAKRMESTAPIGGLRVSEALFDILEETGIADRYYQQFKREAGALSGAFRDITKDELFKPSRVILQDKKGANFESYSVQVEPNLPESIASQAEDLLARDQRGANTIIELLKYYRGNRFVTGAVERVLKQAGVNIRYHDILRWLWPAKHREELKKQQGNHAATVAAISFSWDLYKLFRTLGRLQDILREPPNLESHEPDHFDYDTRMEQERDNLWTNYKMLDESVRKNQYFYNYVYELVWKSVFVSILEYQHSLDSDADALDVEEVEELEAI